MIHLFKRAYIDYIDNFYNLNRTDSIVISKRWCSGHLNNERVKIFHNGDLSEFGEVTGLNSNDLYQILYDSEEKVVLYLDEPDLVKFACRHYLTIMGNVDVDGLIWLLGNFQDEQRVRGYSKFKLNPLCHPAEYVDLRSFIDNLDLTSFQDVPQVKPIDLSVEWILLMYFLYPNSSWKDTLTVKTMSFCDEVLTNTIKRIKERIFREGTELGRLIGDGEPWVAGTMFDNLQRYPEYIELLNCKGLNTVEGIKRTISLESIKKTAYDGHNLCFDVMSESVREKMSDRAHLIEDYERSVADLKMELDYGVIPKAIYEGDIDTLIDLNIYAGQPMTYARGANKEEVSFAIINSILRAKRLGVIESFERFKIKELW